METAAIAIQQAQLQTNMALSMVKKNAQSEQSLVNMIAQQATPAPTGGRGQQLDITV